MDSRVEYINNEKMMGGEGRGGERRILGNAFSESSLAVRIVILPITYWEQHVSSRDGAPKAFVLTATRGWNESTFVANLSEGVFSPFFSLVKAGG